MWLQPDRSRDVSQTDIQDGHKPPAEVSESDPALLGDQVYPGQAGAGQWLATLDEFGVQHLVLDKSTDFDLLRAVQSQGGWLTAFEDRDAVLFSRIGAVPP